MQAEEKKDEFQCPITHWYQPIYCLKGNHILGYEALMRHALQAQVSPADLFIAADRYGYRNVLDLLSIRVALETFTDSNTLLFLNIFPSTLLHENFLSWWDIHAPFGLPVTLELLESEPVMNWGGLKSTVRQLRDRGVKIAIDDMGRGYSFFQQWIELDPDFVKLDRYFSENLSINARKQKTVSSLINLLSDSAQIILEGIETKEDLDAAELLGLSYGQGYLLGRPSP